MAPESEIPQVPLKRGPGRPRKSESAISSSSPAMAPKKLPAQNNASKVTKDGGIRKTSGTKPTGTGPNVKYVKPPLSRTGASNNGSQTQLPNKPAERIGPNVKYVKKPLSQETPPVKKGPGRPPKSGTPDLFATSTKAFSQPPVLSNTNEVDKLLARPASLKSDASNVKPPDPRRSAQAYSQPRAQGGRFVSGSSKADANKKSHAIPGPLAPGFGAPNDKSSASISQLPTPPATGFPAQNKQSFASLMAQKSQLPQPPRTPPPFRERREVKQQQPIVFSPPVQGALQARPGFGHVTVGVTGIPVEEVHAFLRRFLRLQATNKYGKPVYEYGSVMYTQTVNSLIHLTMNWQSAHNLWAYDRYTLEYCSQNGRNVGTAIVTRALALGLSNGLRSIMLFFDNQAKMAEHSITKASAKDRVESTKCGACSWIWVQMMDKAFFEEARDKIIVLARQERERIDKEKKDKEERARENALWELEKRVAFVARISGQYGRVDGEELEIWDDMD